ncbi:MAG: ion transporter [Rhizobiales bacterium]|nr:ion transporter [Hyphomicrobiales bacterium]
MRETVGRLVTAPRFERAITVLIVINAFILGLETSERAMAAAGELLTAIDRIILGVFVIEVAARIFVRGQRAWRDPWLVFDFTVVAIALVPATGDLSVLRALRVLRVLRLISTVSSMRRVVAGLLNALPGMGSIVALLTLLFYVFAVMATKLYGADYPQWFGTVGDSAFSLFQIMTLESWSQGIVRPVMVTHPFAWLFFVPFILATSFTVLNLFIGIIVDAMQSEHEQEMEEERAAQKAEAEHLLEEIKALRRDVGQLSAAVNRNQPPREET